MHALYKGHTERNDPGLSGSKASIGARPLALAKQVVPLNAFLECSGGASSSQMLLLFTTLPHVPTVEDSAAEQGQARTHTRMLVLVEHVLSSTSLHWCLLTLVALSSSKVVIRAAGLSCELDDFVCFWYASSELIDGHVLHIPQASRLVVVCVVSVRKKHSKTKIPKRSFGILVYEACQGKLRRWVFPQLNQHPRFVSHCVMGFATNAIKKFMQPTVHKTNL